MKKCRGFTLIELMMTVAIVGLLAAVAIPSYVKYIRRSQVTEATMNLRKIYDAAASYYVSEHAGSSGTILAKQFPGNAGPSPAAIPCGVKRQPQITDFDTPEWGALDFSIGDPYRYQYTFSNLAASGGNVNAAAQAAGDLDCDGLSSLFQRHLSGTHDGVSGDSGLYAVNETE